MKFYFSNISAILAIIFFMYAFFINVKMNKKKQSLILCTIFALSFLAFFFDPIKTWQVKGNYTDLYRYYSDISAFQRYGFNGEPRMFLTLYNTIPLTKIFIYFISLTKINGLLPFLTCMITYGIEALILLNFSKINKMSSKITCICFFTFLALTNYKVVITNIRMPIGLALFAYLLYKEFYCNKTFKQCLIGYILLCGIHSVFILFLFIRIIVLLANKFSMKIICIVSLFSGSLLPYVYNLLLRYSGSSVINSIISKIDFYTSEKIAEYSEPWIIFLGIAKILFLFYTIRKCKKIDNIDNGTKKMFDISYVFMLFSIGAIWNFHLFHRMTNFLIFLIPLCQMKFYQMMNENERRNMSLYNTVTMGVVVVHLFYFFFSYQYRVLWF